MKYRKGFVSNSSSASFIIKFKSSLSKEEIGKLIKTDDQYLKSAWDKPQSMLDVSESDFKNGELKYKNIDKIPLKERKLRQDDSYYYYEADTIMFNDWTDVPGWKFIRLIKEKKHPDIELKDIRQTYDEHDEVDKEAEFDSHIWNYDEDRNAQFQIEREYVQYLADINIEISNEELKKLLL